MQPGQKRITEQSIEGKIMSISKKITRCLWHKRIPGAATLMLSVLLLSGCIETGIVMPWQLPNWSLAWSEKYKGTQIKEMVAVDMEMDSEGSTYTLGQMLLIDGSKWAVLLKYNRFGIKEVEKIFKAGNDNQTVPRAMAKDKYGDIIIVGERQVAGNWFVTKINGQTLAIIWDVNRFSGDKGSAYTVSVGNSGTVYVAGNHSNWDRYATAFFDGNTGANIYEQTRGCCSNGTVNATNVWDSLVVYDANGKEWFYTTYPGNTGTTGTPGDIAIRYYKNDVGNVTAFDNTSFGGLDSNASDYQLALHPDGYLLFAGNDGDTAEVFKIVFGTTGITSVSSIMAFDKKFKFRAMTFDSVGSLYIAGDTIDPNSAVNVNGYIAKYDASCVTVYSKLCWDHTFNHTMLFNIKISLLGRALVESFTKEEVRDIFIANNYVYLQTSSDTSDANVASKKVTEFVGFSKGSGNPANQIQISASDSVAAMLNPYDPTRVHVVGVNANADLTEDPDIYLYTNAVKGF